MRGPISRRRWLSAGVPRLLGLLILMVAVLPLHSARGANASNGQDPTRIGQWDYDVEAASAFAAFTGPKSAVLESRWGGPQSLALGRNAFPFPVPFSKSHGISSKYAASGAISPDRKLLATELRGPKFGSWRVCLWRLNQRHPKPVVMAGLAHSLFGRCLAFSPHGRSVVFLGWLKRPWRRAIFVDSSTTGAVLHCLTLPPATGDLANSFALQFVSPDLIVCGLSALGSSPVRIACLSTASGRVTYEKKFPMLKAADTMASCPGRRLLLLAGLTSGTESWPTVCLLRARTGRLAKSVEIKKGSQWNGRNMMGRYISDICISRGGRYAVCTEIGLPDKSAMLGASASRFVIIDLRLAKVVYFSPLISRDAVWHVDISPHGNRLLFAGNARLFVLRTPFKL